MTLAEYFKANRPVPKYEFGERVFGLYSDGKQKIPFIGSVGADNLVSEEEGVAVTILLDLPIKTTKGIRTVIRVPYKSIKKTLKST